MRVPCYSPVHSKTTALSSRPQSPRISARDTLQYILGRSGEEILAWRIAPGREAIEHTRKIDAGPTARNKQPEP
eukprot:5613999-Pyramimonas_sp.AAC.1